MSLNDPVTDLAQYPLYVRCWSGSDSDVVGSPSLTPKQTSAVHLKRDGFIAVDVNRQHFCRADSDRGA
jgi:hypothetical protein